MPTILKRGDRWQAKVRRKGYPPQSDTFPTKAMAERWARDIESQIDAGRFQPVAAAAKGLTLGDALRRYLRDVTAKKEDPRPEQLKIAKIIEHPIALRELSRLTGADFAEFRDGLRKRNGEPMAANTLRLYLAPLSHLYSVARTEWGFAGLANPLLDIAKPKPGPARTRRAQGDELAQILKAAKQVAPWAPVLIEFAVESAMRRGELAKLRWEAIDWTGRTAHLPKTKNGRPRDVPLSPRAIAILKRWRAGQEAGPVFPAHRDTISKAMIEARALAGVEGLRLHDLRREATSRLFERGDLSIGEVAQVTGHQTWQMLRVYTQPRAQEIARKLAGKPGQKKPAPA